MTFLELVRANRPPGRGPAGEALRSVDFPAWHGSQTGGHSVRAYGRHKHERGAAVSRSGMAAASPPAEKASAHQDQTWNASTNDGTGNFVRRA